MMNIYVGRLLKFAGIAAMAGTTLMQGQEQGKFHLPFEARWGQAVLQPGDYTVLTPRLAEGEMEFRVIDSRGKAIFELPRYSETLQYTEHSWLTLKSIDGEYFVCEYTSGAAGKTYTFPAPKASHRQLSAKSTEDKLALMVR